MSLDATETSLRRLGKVTIEGGSVYIEGFEGNNTSCRDLAVLACMWAIGELQRECLKDIQRPGGGNVGIG